MIAFHFCMDEVRYLVALVPFLPIVIGYAVALVAKVRAESMGPWFDGYDEEW